MTVEQALNGFALHTKARAGTETTVARRLLAGWDACDLATRFALAATAVIGFGMIVLVWWVSGRIEAGVVEHAATAIALNSDSVVEPHLQALAVGEDVPPAEQEQLRTLVHHGHHPGGILAITAWTAEGKLAFFADKDATRVPEPFSEKLKAAPAKYDTSLSIPRLSVVVPMHDGKSGRLIAFAKIDSNAHHLTQQLSKVSAETAVVTGLLSMAMIGLLFGIVWQANQTIAEQRKALAERISTLSELLDKNALLQNQLLNVTRRSSETNDRALRRIGAELHDGPVQLIALSLLRLEGLRRPLEEAGDDDSDADVNAIESALRDALTEMRGISAGLSLPRLEGGTVARAVEYAVMNHEKRSRTRVQLDVGQDLPDIEDASILACVYRFTQECLNNSTRHAKGKGQSVRATFAENAFVVEVCDEGPGFDPRAPASWGNGLGLIGLADRLQALGGHLETGNRSTGGARVAAILPIAPRRPDFSEVPWG